MVPDAKNADYQKKLFLENPPNPPIENSYLSRSHATASSSPASRLRFSAANLSKELTSAHLL
jgi:hypothetical protein